MDRLLYVAMSGARETQVAQAVTSHNLANASSHGFRATLAGASHVPLTGPGHAAARAYAVTEGQGTDFTPGPLMATGRDLDVAIEGEGWIAVQAPDGGEAYTRAGDLRVDAFGLLTNGSGRPVMGDGGPIALPPFETLEVAGDGTISIRPLGQEAVGLAVVERIRLVNPPAGMLERGEDGLMRLANGAVAEAAADVRLMSGMLEGSNVNVIGSMVEMIQHARSFEIQIKMMGTAEENDRASSDLMRLG
ncbi:MAG: flagellar basal body rod protein FlgF [Gammaproteobacteria bacterium]|nr:MAG: flagellar basal body rod protein FlgF [Gammaproteobacteria bacterium]